MKDKTTSVGFRLSEIHHQTLGVAASKYGLSPGAFARRLVVDALTDAERLRVLNELDELRQLVERLREDVGTATEALLADAGNASGEEAKEFVRTKMGL